MKVVVTGASGLLGRQVYTALQGLAESVTGFCFSRKADNLVPVDLTKQEALQQVIEAIKPDVIVHCAAERRPDVVEKRTNDAEKLNVAATEALCSAANGLNAWLVYISTDYVFDGKAPPYDIHAAPNPLNTYGKMKLAGEKVVLQSNPKNAVLRVPILYGPVEYLSESAVTVLFEKVRDTSKACLMDHRQRRYPTHTRCVADILKKMIARHSENKFSINGIYHFTEPVMMTKYEMAVKMAEAAGLPSHHISADQSEPSPGATPRPFDCQLDTSRLLNEGFELESTNFSSAITEVIKSHM